MPEVTPLDQLYYGPAQAAKAIGVSRPRIYQLLRDGSLTAKKLGTRTLIPREALVAMVESGPDFVSAHAA